jgi:creatinine amidohydrolase
MRALRIPAAALVVMLFSLAAIAQTNPVWHEVKTKNYLPHMTWPEVRDLLTRSDVALIPVPSIEQHGPQTPMGTDYYAGVERLKLIAQRTDALVVPVLLAGQSPYHMDFPGTITLSADTMQRVYFETAQSLIQHGFRRILLHDSHAGNQYVTRYVVDRINQETKAVAVDLNDAVETMRGPAPSREASTAQALLVDLDKATQPQLSLPPHLSRMLPLVAAGDRAATMMFLAEALKPKETGKNTSTAEMSLTGVWSERNPREATAEQGRRDTEAFVDAAVRFIDRWKELRPLQRP